MITIPRLIPAILFIIGLTYVLLPGPLSIDDFPGLPISTKSNLEGDTIQNPNIAAYFSDFRRDYITKYYRNILSRKLIGIPLPVISLNHPPELAYQYVRDQQESTFLEEYVFPLRESIFVNGYEPLVENTMYNKQHSDIGDHILYRNSKSEEEVSYDSKTTLRFYPSSLISRLVIYLGIWASSFCLFKLYQKIKKGVL